MMDGDLLCALSKKIFTRGNCFESKHHFDQNQFAVVETVGDALADDGVWLK